MQNRLQRALLRFRRGPIVVVQLVLVALSNLLAHQFRFDGDVPAWAWASFWESLPWLVVIRGTVFVPFRLYEGLWRYTSLYDLQAVLAAVVCSSIAFSAYVLSPLGPAAYSRGTLFIDAAIVLLFLGAIRMVQRVSSELLRPLTGRRVVVYGAGSAGEMIVRELKQQHRYGFTPVGFIDDDPAKRGMRIHGVPVLGSRDDLDVVVRTHSPAVFLIAIPSARPEARRAVANALVPFNIPVKTLPHLGDLIDGVVRVDHIRSLAIEDLLTRAPIGLDSAQVKALIHGRRVMVTGAGGSIGSELCRQILRLRPAKLVLFERYENGLHAIRMELESGADLNSRAAIHPIIGDITDEPAVEAVLRRFRPEIVFHAAAHKHVPLMEENPCEAVKNNIRGTRMLAAAADKWGVDRFIFISTDKAANPTSLMGASKQVAEQLVLQQSAGSGTSFSIVRFGNVLGSNGSVVLQFLDQIKRGGPVTVTHPEVRRYFMLIPEAVQLVLHAAAQAHRSGTYLLDMGQQIRVLDIAHNLIRQAGFVPDEDIKVVFIGLREGEKLEEELIGNGEELRPSATEGVSLVVRAAPSINLMEDVSRLEAVALAGSEVAVVEQLRRLAGMALVRPGATTSADQTRVVSLAPDNVASGERHVRCPRCHVGGIHRVKSHGVRARIRKRLSAARLHRCNQCDWRGWLVPVEFAGDAETAPEQPLDLAALDATTTVDVSRRKPDAGRPFAPRDL